MAGVERTGTEAAGVRLAELVAALSLATDLGVGQPLELALRACALALRLGEALGLDEAELRETYYVALLRSSGCTADALETARVFGDEIVARGWLATIDFGRPSAAFAGLARHAGARRRGRTLGGALAALPRVPGIYAAHCEVAQLLAGRLGLDSGVVAALGQVFERWDGRGLPRRVAGEAIRRSARIVALSTDAVIFLGGTGLDGTVALIRRRAGGAYDPRVAATFCTDAGRLVAGLERDMLWASVLAS